MSSRDDQARSAGNILYGSVNHSERATHTGLDNPLTSESVNFRSSDSNMEGEPISALRRTFCLLVLFDLIITVILWLIFTEVKSDGDSLKAFTDQVVEYKFTTSMFDTVMLSAFRFVALILPYALFRSNMPWFVAITTFITCVLMICKCIMYQYNADKSLSGVEILDILVLVASVVLAWVETWFMDLRVLPHEKKERERILAAQRAANEYTENSPLLSRFLRPSRTEESYYSPEHSEDDSLDSDDDNKSFHSAYGGRNHSRTQSLTSSISQTTHYKGLIDKAKSDALEMLDSEGWKREAGTDDVVGIVYSKTTKATGKIFKMVAEIDINALLLFRDLVDNASSMPKWNPTVLECRTLEHIDDDTDISYNVAAEGAAGMVSCRDFVYVRHWEQNNGMYITCSVSVEHPSMPPQPKYVRGEQGPTLIRLKDIDNNKLKWEWLLNTNLKGWLPQYLIDQALSGVLLAYLDNLRKHALTLSSSAT